MENAKVFFFLEFRLELNICEILEPSYNFTFICNLMCKLYNLKQLKKSCEYRFYKLKYFFQYIF